MKQFDNSIEIICGTDEESRWVLDAIQTPCPERDALAHLLQYLPARLRIIIVDLASPTDQVGLIEPANRTFTIVILRDADLDVMLDFLDNGANGIAFLSSPPEAVVAIALSALRGELIIPSSLWRKARSEQRDDVQLLPGDRDILKLLVKGKTNKEIGKQLFLSERTVARRCLDLYVKLGVKGRRAAIEKWGYLQDDEATSLP